MVTCSFYSFGDKFLDEIIHVLSLIALSMWDYLPANVLKPKDRFSYDVAQTIEGIRIRKNKKTIDHFFITNGLYRKIIYEDNIIISEILMKPSLRFSRGCKLITELSTKLHFLYIIRTSFQTDQLVTLWEVRVGWF